MDHGSPSSHGSVTHWIHEIKDGNHDAAQAIWERYYLSLMRVARVGLYGQRRVADEEDVATTVFESFFRAAENGRFPDLSDRDGLWRLLVKMAARRSIDQSRRWQRQRRGGGRIRGESVFFDASHSPDDQQQTIADVVGETPTPEFAAMMTEQVSILLDRLTKPELRKLAVAKMQGITNKELSEQLDCSERTIERRLHMIRTCFAEEVPD